MSKIEKFLEIKQEIKDHWSQLTWTRKKELLKEVYKISPMPNSVYRISLFVIIVAFLGIFLTFCNSDLFKPFLVKENSPFTLSVSILFLGFSIFILIYYLKDRKFNKDHGIEFKTLKLKLFNDINKSEEHFYKVVNDNLDDLSDQISQNLVRDHCLPEDMVEKFTENAKIAMYQFRFKPVDQDGSGDEGHSATRHALLEENQ